MYDKVQSIKGFIEGKISTKPQTAIILGSGLDAFAQLLENKISIKYEDIPHFPRSLSAVKGHAGELVFGSLKGKELMLMCGRFHLYEGFSTQEVARPIYAMKALGIKQLFITNACGGINTNYSPGSLVLLKDFINLMGQNPLTGPNDERFGPRFPDMSEPFSLRLIALAQKVAKSLDIHCEEGVYAGFPGPYFESAAEIRAMSILGADVVGMSTVPECIAANYLGLEVLGISCVTNMATGIQACKHSHEAVLEVAKLSSDRLCSLLKGIIEAL